MAMIRLSVDASMTSSSDPDLSVGCSVELVKANPPTRMPVRERYEPLPDTDPGHQESGDGRIQEKRRIL